MGLITHHVSTFVNVAFGQNLNMPRRATVPPHPSFQRLLQAFGATGSGDERPVVALLMRKLGASRQSIGNWKTRGISKECALDAERETGVSAQWLLDGVGPRTPTTQPEAHKAQEPHLATAAAVFLDALRACPHKEELRVLLPLLLETDAPPYRARLLQLLGADVPRLPADSRDFYPPVPQQAETK